MLNDKLPFFIYDGLISRSSGLLTTRINNVILSQIFIGAFVMKVKNPEIIEKILLADSEQRLEIIRSHAEHLTVSDLNEISVRLIENLTSSVENYDKSQKLKKIEVLSRKKEESNTDKTTDYNHINEPDVGETINEELTSSVDDTLKKKKLPFFIVGIVLASIAYMGVFLIYQSLAPLAPLVVSILFGILGILGRPTKSALIGSSLIMLFGNFSNYVVVFDNFNSGNIMADTMPVFLVALGILSVATSLLWTESKK